VYDTIVAGKKARRLVEQSGLLGEKIDLRGKKAGWIRIWADVYCGNWDGLGSTYLVATILNDSVEIKKKSYSIGRVMDWNEWKTINIDIHLPAAKATSIYGGLELSQHAAPVYLGNLRIEYTPSDN
jgi:hypothetical protein